MMTTTATRTAMMFFFFISLSFLLFLECDAAGVLPAHVGGEFVADAGGFEQLRQRHVVAIGGFDALGEASRRGEVELPGRRSGVVCSAHWFSSFDGCG